MCVLRSDSQIKALNSKCICVSGCCSWIDVSAAVNQICVLKDTPSPRRNIVTVTQDRLATGPQKVFKKMTSQPTPPLIDFLTPTPLSSILPCCHSDSKAACQRPSSTVWSFRRWIKALPFSLSERWESRKTQLSSAPAAGVTRF